MLIFLIHAVILSVAFQPGESVELTVITLNGRLGFDPTKGHKPQRRLRAEYAR